MAEEDGRLPSTAPIAGLPTTLATPANRVDPIAQIDIKIAMSQTPDEADRWLRVRAEAVQQVNLQKEAAHARGLEIAGACVKTASSVGAVGLGAFFVMSGAGFVGFFCIGAGLSIFAPKYVGDFMKKWNGQ